MLAHVLAMPAFATFLAPSAPAHSITRSQPKLCATPRCAAGKIEGSTWKIILNVGREQGTKMPSEWAASGARLSLPLQVTFADEASDDERVLEEDDALDEPIKRLVCSDGISCVLPRSVLCYNYELGRAQKSRMTKSNEVCRTGNAQAHTTVPAPSPLPRPPPRVRSASRACPGAESGVRSHIRHTVGRTQHTGPYTRETHFSLSRQVHVQTGTLHTPDQGPAKRSLSVVACAPSLSASHDILVFVCGFAPGSPNP